MATSSSTGLRSFFDCVSIYPVDIASIEKLCSLVRTPVLSYVVERCNRITRMHAARNGNALPSSDFSSTSTSGACTNSSSSSEVLWIDPSVVQAMVAFGDASIGPLDDIQRHNCIVFPLSTCVDEAASDNGGHWSTAVLTKSHVMSEPSAAVTSPSSSSSANCCCWVLDSCGQRNVEATRRLLRVLGLSEVNLRVVSAFPQQDNAFDCGVMVCLALERVCCAALGRKNEDDHSSALCRVEELLRAGSTDEWLGGAPSAAAACSVLRKKLSAELRGS